MRLDREALRANAREARDLARLIWLLGVVIARAVRWGGFRRNTLRRSPRARVEVYGALVDFGIAFAHTARGKERVEALRGLSRFSVASTHALRAYGAPRDLVVREERFALRMIEHARWAERRFAELYGPQRAPRRVQHKRGNHTIRGRSRAARHAAPRVSGSRRTAARTAMNTGPPGADDGGGEPEPPPSWSTPGADRRTERTKRTKREQGFAWTAGGLCRRVANQKHERPRGWHLTTFQNRASERGRAGLDARILARIRRTCSTSIARATETADGGCSDARARL